MKSRLTCSYIVVIRYRLVSTYFARACVAACPRCLRILINQEKHQDMAETSELWGVIQRWLDTLPYPPSQAKLAKRIGITDSAMSEWKYGTSRPKPENLRALADEMEAVAGTRVYDDLLRAINIDQGYVSKEAAG